MRLSFSTLGCPSYSIDAVLNLARKEGYEGVALRTLRNQVMLPELSEFSPEGIGETAKKFREAKIAVSCVMSGVHFNATDREEWRYQLQVAKTYLEIAQALEAPSIRVFGGSLTPDTDPQKILPRVVEGLRQTSEWGEKKGVYVLLETHDSFSTGKQVRKLLESVSHSYLGVVWDFLHSLRFGETPEETWNLLGPWVKDVHIKDSAAYSAESFDLKLPGKGNLPIPKILSLLNNQSYRQWLTFEWEKAWHPEIEEPEVAIPYFASYIKQQLRELEL
ncbi:MAG: sugar phosphate isomerase/epimerase family protein [Spirochaetales bacterium]